MYNMTLAQSFIIKFQRYHINIINQNFNKKISNREQKTSKIRCCIKKDKIEMYVLAIS